MHFAQKHENGFRDKSSVCQIRLSNKTQSYFPLLWRLPWRLTLDVQQQPQLLWAPSEHHVGMVPNCLYSAENPPWQVSYFHLLVPNSQICNKQAKQTFLKVFLVLFCFDSGSRLQVLTRNRTGEMTLNWGMEQEFIL